MRRLSGQDLGPLLVDGDRVVVDSMTIVRRLEDHDPAAPRLYPTDAARDARVTGRRFHGILARYQKPGNGDPRVVCRIDRLDRLPRA